MSTTSAEIAIILLASLIFLSTVLVVMSLTLRSRWDEIANPDRRKRERKR